MSTIEIVAACLDRAEHQRAVVELLDAHARDPMGNGKPLAEQRGQGIAQQLLEAVEVKARELGCCKVTLEVDEHNHRAHQLYRAAGFGLSDRIPKSGQWQFITKPV